MIPIFKPSVSQREIDAVTDVLNSGWWGMGAKVEELEEKFAKFVGVRYAIALNSATAALDLSLKVNNVTDGEVILPALTFVSDGLAALYNNNKVVFADIDENTLCIDWEDAFQKITPKTKAIIPVWYGGKMTSFVQFRHSKYDLTQFFSSYLQVIEDCAHAAGTKNAGLLSSSAVWSFHAVKNIAAGDGGMITTNNKAHYDRLKTLRWCGIDKSTWEREQKRYGWDYSIAEVGYKMHMNDITAAIALVQLDRLPEMNAKRKAIVKTYVEKLSDLDWLRLPEWDEDISWHMFVVRVDNHNNQRNRFIDYLLSNGIAAGVHYKPLTSYKIFPGSTPLPVTDKVWQRLVTLPLFPDLTAQELEHIIRTIRKFK